MAPTGADIKLAMQRSTPNVAVAAPISLNLSAVLLDDSQSAGAAVLKVFVEVAVEAVFVFGSGWLILKEL
jgi:hypothetical protein